MNALSIKNLTIAIDQRVLIKNLKVGFKPGEVWGIFGPNGVGKTTLMHTIAGLYPPAQGDVRLGSQVVHKLKSRSRAQQIGVLFQNVAFSFPSTVFESALMGRYPHKRAWFGESDSDKERIHQVLAQMNLEDFEHRLASSLSGGEKRRLMLATLLAQDPFVYLLDEPTNHLDWRHQVRTLSLLQRLAKENGKIVVMIMHDIHLMRRFCDRVIILSPDAKNYVGDSHQWLQEDRLKSIFGEIS